MSLRMFHLFFIAISIVLAAFFGAWATAQYRLAGDSSDALAAVAAVVSAIVLAVYGAKFQRKTRNL